MSKKAKRRLKGPPARPRLSDITTRRPSDGAAFAVVTLGGTSLYAPDDKWLGRAVDRIQAALESVLAENLLMARNYLEKLTRQHLGEDVGDRVLGAVLGRSLRFGNTDVLACLTLHGRIMRMHFHSRKLEEINKKLRLLDRLLEENTAISVDAAQSACFPNRGWGTRFIAQQLLSHLAYKGRAVFMDEGLFASPFTELQDALRNHH